MDTPDNPTDPKEVELTEVDKKTPPEKNNKKQQQLIINVKITFCTHVGWDGVLVRRGVGVGAQHRKTLRMYIVYK
jgi:hypothetical protein